jgi:mRNA interferase MazF
MSQSNPERGDVWEVDLGEPRGHEMGFMHPALIVSSKAYNEAGLGLYVVLPMTSKEKSYIDSHIPISYNEGDMRRNGFIKCEDVRSISRDRLITCHGRVSDEIFNDALNMLYSYVFDMESTTLD